VKVRKDTEQHEPEVRLCKVRGCGGMLRDDGFCIQGQGWPFYFERQPVVCPHCRESLHWSGHCMKCWDTHERTGPGYCHEEVNGHWQNTGERQRMCGLQEIRDNLPVISAMLGVRVDA